MSLKLDAKTTALIVIDLEHGIVGRDTTPYPPSDVITRSAGLAAALRAAGGTVAYVHVLMEEFAKREVDEPTKLPPVLPANVSKLVPECGYNADTDILIAKRQWDGFHGEPSLDAELQKHGIKTVIMAGIATNMGVESTARSANALGYDVVMAEDAMSSMGDGMHEFSVTKLFPRMSRVRSTAEILEALKG